jgi:hypothetical protein
MRAGVDSEPAQVRGDDLRREPLAEREDEIPRARGRLLRVRDSIEEPFELRREGLDRLDARILAGVGQEGAMLPTQLRDVAVDLLLFPWLCQGGDEGIRHAGDRGNDDELPPAIRLEDLRNPLIHVRAAHAVPTELRDCPRFNQDIPSDAQAPR